MGKQKKEKSQEEAEFEKTYEEQYYEKEKYANEHNISVFRQALDLQETLYNNGENPHSAWVAIYLTREESVRSGIETPFPSWVNHYFKCIS